MRMDIAQALNTHRVDPDEIKQILLGHFGGATQSSAREVTYASASGTPALHVSFDKFGRILSAKRDSGLRETDLAELVSTIEYDLVAPSAD